jgi:hypothetical protein
LREEGAAATSVAGQGSQAHRPHELQRTIRLRKRKLNSALEQLQTKINVSKDNVAKIEELR